jgi:hypothetical protein
MELPKTPAEVVEHLFSEALQSCERLAQALKETKRTLDGDTTSTVAAQVHELDKALDDVLQRVTAFRCWTETVRKARGEHPQGWALTGLNTLDLPPPLGHKVKW